MRRAPVRRAWFRHRRYFHRRKRGLRRDFGWLRLGDLRRKCIGGTRGAFRRPSMPASAGIAKADGRGQPEIAASLGSAGVATARPASTAAGQRQAEKRHAEECHKRGTCAIAGLCGDHSSARAMDCVAWFGEPQGGVSAASVMQLGTSGNIGKLARYSYIRKLRRRLNRHRRPVGEGESTIGSRFRTSAR